MGSVGLIGWSDVIVSLQGCQAGTAQEHPPYVDVVGGIGTRQISAGTRM